MKRITSYDLSESLDIIKDQAIDAIRGLLNERLGEKGSIGINYYCIEADVIRYDFHDTDRNGYGVGINIDTIEIDDDELTFIMVDQDGDGWSEREVGDFTTTEVVWILEMLEDAFNVIDDEFNGIIIPSSSADYKYDKNGKTIGIIE
jgi:hypothetical protein